MNYTSPVPEDFAPLYRQAFSEYGTQALWNKRLLKEPTPEDALVIAHALRVEGDREARKLAEQIEKACRGLSKIQTDSQALIRCGPRVIEMEAHIASSPAEDPRRLETAAFYCKHIYCLSAFAEWQAKIFQETKTRKTDPWTFLAAVDSVSG